MTSLGTGRELWRWTQSGPRTSSHGPNGGVADTLDEATAAFREAWDARGVALSQRTPAAKKVSANSTPSSRRNCGQGHEFSGADRYMNDQRIERRREHDARQTAS
jgi:hypothetical protein